MSILKTSRRLKQSEHQFQVLHMRRNLAKGDVDLRVGNGARVVALASFTLKKYSTELSLTAWICFMGMVQSAGVSLPLVMVRDLSAWKLGLDSRFLAATYSGIVCSGVTYYEQGVVIRQRGPVFVTSFSPLCMIITAALGAIVLAENILGAIIIVSGLYTVVWDDGWDGADKIVNIWPAENSITKGIGIKRSKLVPRIVLVSEILKGRHFIKFNEIF
ncbi:hypothetical protein GQ457_01G012330 [Hibiscus cannabinus]